MTMTETTNVNTDTAGGRLQQLLFVAGIAEIAVGLLHFFMPIYYRRSAGLANASLDEHERAYVALVTYAVGILLLAFGAMTLTFARRPAAALDVLVPYLTIKCVLWAARLGLEVVYPVRLEMFGIDPFTILVLPGVAAELVVFIVATVLARRLDTNTASH